MSFAYMHEEAGGCGKVAFYYSHMPAAGEKISSSVATQLDGNPVEYGSELRCGSCGNRFRANTKYVREVTEST